MATQLDGPHVLLGPNTAQMIAVALHELATNAAKYGALSVAKGRVEVKWSLVANDQLILTWKEKGGPQHVEGAVEKMPRLPCHDWQEAQLLALMRTDRAVLKRCRDAQDLK